MDVQPHERDFEAGAIYLKQEKQGDVTEVWSHEDDIRPRTRLKSGHIVVIE